MPDSPAGSAAFLAGQEIVNDARTLAYLANGYGPLNMQISGGCACDRIRELIECDSDPYTSPAADPAPWYDVSVPESADFAGFLTTEFEGLGSTFTRTPTDKITGGAVLGRLKPGPRTMIWRGYLFGRSDCAVRYGLSWMTANLSGNPACDTSCGGEELELLVCCPELTETPPISGCASLPAIQRPSVCPPFTEPNAFRSLKNVGLVDGPKILSQRKIGCKNCGNFDCAGDSLIMEIEFTLIAGNPYLYGCPVCLCVDQGFVQPADCAEGDFWLKVDPATAPADCGHDDCVTTTDCTETDSLCDPVDLPDIPPFEDGCFCDPLQPIQNCCPIDSSSFSQFFEGAPVIEITTGAKPMRATTVRFFENLLGKDCCDVSSNPCLNCDSLQIRYIPPHSTLTIDGTTRRVTILCPGVTIPQSAEHLTVTPFAWPILQCIDFCICVETDGIVWGDDPPDATVTVMIHPREM